MINFLQSGNNLSVACTSPAVPASGDPVRFGLMTGVATIDEDTDGNTMVAFGGGVYTLSVTDVATGGIGVGAALFLHDGSPPTITNVSADGYFFGFALEVIGSGLTAVIKVLHSPSPAAGTLGAGTVGTTNLAADAVDNTILDNIARGYIKVGGVANAPTDLNAKTTAQILIGDGTDLVSVAVTGDISLSAAGVVKLIKFGPYANATVSAQAASATLTNSSAGKILTNTGAGAGIVLTLPAVATMTGLFMRFAVTVAQTIQLLPATGEIIFLNGSGVASKYALIAGVIGNFCDVYCDGAYYFVTNYNGVVTKEA